jgi:ABC-type branched-subunit amino acid transport system ATPase component
MKEVFEIASMLGIAELPLGMPVALLATHHRRLLAIAHAMVAGTTGRPSLIVVEEPGAGFSEKQHKGEEEAIAHPAFSERVSWIGVYGR